MNIKDLLFLILVALTAGLVANHYYNLDIGFLTNIENSLISSGRSGTSSTRGIGGMEPEAKKSKSAECERLVKANTDLKILTRNELEAAKKARDISKTREVEARLEEIARREREVCR